MYTIEYNTYNNMTFTFKITRSDTDKQRNVFALGGGGGGQSLVFTMHMLQAKQIQIKGPLAVHSKYNKKAGYFYFDRL